MSDDNKIEIIIEYEDTISDRIIMDIGKVKYKLPIINAYVVEISKDDIAKIKSINGLKAVHDNTNIAAQLNIARKTINVDSTHDSGIDGRGVTIAILDTGIAPIEDFTVPRNRIIAFKDFIQNKTTPYDDNGHGTHVAYLLDMYFILQKLLYCFSAKNKYS